MHYDQMFFWNVFHLPNVSQDGYVNENKPGEDELKAKILPDRKINKSPIYRASVFLVYPFFS